MAMAAMSVISPRSSNYERLEGGMGPTRMGVPHQPNKGWRRFGWKKFAVGAAVLILVVWLWGPRESRLDWQKVKEGIKKPFTGGKPNDVLIPPIHNEEDYGKSAGNNAKPPLSFETDPDPRKTTFCTKPHDPSAHLVQYALMIDAGSTGSRIHVYKFNNCKDSPQYEYEVFKMTQPGLSSYAGKPLEAARSLDVLLDVAVDVVPKELHHCTPVAVKATAGLRLLPGRQSNDILEKVEQRIHEHYDFQLADHDPVSIMDGKDEGVYAWITANYLLGTISAGGTTKSSDTFAVLDLGGASTQIVFEPNFTPMHPSGRLEEGEHKYDLDFGGKKYELYQHSHVHRLVDFMASIRPGATTKFHPIDQDGDGHPDIEAIPNPCLAKGTYREVEVKDEVTGKLKKVWMAGEEVGSFEACQRVVQLVLAKDAVCEMKPCSFNGVYQPSLLDSFKNGKVLLLSYFYDRLAPLLPPSSAAPLSVDSFASMAKKVCEGPAAWKKEKDWASNKELMEEIEGRPEYCLDLTFMHSLLRLGYEFEGERRIDIGKQIKNTELGWCLGATIAMVSGGELKCKA
ncbi:guanosine-diphosphatase [Coprinellus micaceus]|uniref:guanosine-diphosphatase n=1 Tax=Coprinellus micaceus TaxID=71717 RepID=A0A4Y7T1G7_COPMI|nr:guanosine-diphosphatase [Coprinellus micaceus]